MNSYNIAVTVGPNIFRPQQSTSDDVVNVGIYYQILIKMIDYYDYIFGESPIDEL